MQITERIVGSERAYVAVGLDRESGYHGVIALHSTALGPAVGGTRFWPYASEDEAVSDALRLARGMSYKSAFAGLPFGGGKSVIIGDNRAVRNRERLFRAHGRFVESLGGRYVTAVDVGTSPADLLHVSRETRHVACLDSASGDPSPLTAHGVFRAMQAALKFRRGADELSGVTVALQGCGHVGYNLARELYAAGARLVAADADAERAGRLAQEFGARVVRPEEIFDAPTDIFAPCALGGVINDETVPRLKAEIVTGAANNQLLEPRHGDALEARGILYAPDYVANAGGLIHGCTELLGWTPAACLDKINELYDSILALFETARAERIPTYAAADRIAERRLYPANGLAART